MADIQQQTDIEKAKARIDGAAEERERTNPGSSSVVQAGDQDGQPQVTMTTSKTLPPAAQKSIRPVQAKPKKKGFGQKMKEAFFGEELGDGSITEHIFFRIFVPSFKRVISDMANSAINMALGLDPKTRTIRSGESHAANASLYRDRSMRNGVGYSDGYGRRSAFNEYEWSEDDAKDIYTQIQDIVENYHSVTVADVYAIMGMNSKIRSTDRNWGWTSMRQVEVYPIDARGERWVVDLPPAKPI